MNQQDYKDLEALVEMSHIIGENQAYIQGGGGNTSVKISGGIMPVKASGTYLKNMAVDDCFAAVRYNKVLEYVANVEKDVPDKDYNAEIGKVALDSVEPINGEPVRKPSVEAGFHSVLKKFVAHSHSVYANVFTCQVGGMEAAKAIIEKAGFKVGLVPEMSPGYYLTVYIQKLVNDDPDIQVILMQNHGIIAHGDDMKEVVDIHEKANAALREAACLDEFPVCRVVKHEPGFVSDTPWLKEILADKSYRDKIFGWPLYPDQIVYTGKPEKFIFEDDKIVYNTENPVEGITIEETLAGVAYVFAENAKMGKEINFMGNDAVKYINNWDMEKYRAAQMK
ncbi:MAG: class II aldolase [Clostridia bacterium]|nr:class II aldolase [Clostridia bacterium]